MVIALSRFGGLKIPSELVNLKWEDVNWAKDLSSGDRCQKEDRSAGSNLSRVEAVPEHGLGRIRRRRCLSSQTIQRQERQSKNQTSAHDPSSGANSLGPSFDRIWGLAEKQNWLTDSQFMLSPLGLGTPQRLQQNITFRWLKITSKKRCK